MTSLPRFLLATLIAFASATSLYGDECCDTDSCNTNYCRTNYCDTSNCCETTDCCDFPRGFFTLSGQYDVTAKAKFDKSPEAPGQKLGYAEGEGELRYTRMLDECSGFFVGGGATTTKIDWKENPYFNEKNFHYVDVQVGAFTGALDNWLWKTALKASVDGHSSLYRWILWGRYTYCQDFNVHVGVYTLSGIRKTEVLPIIGVDFKPHRRWDVNLVFPVNMSALYCLTDHFKVELAYRLFWRRHRVGKDEPSPSAIFNYTSSGLQAGVRYVAGSHDAISIGAHGGVMVGGRFKVSGSNDISPIYYKMKGVGYIGGDVSVSF